MSGYTKLTYAKDTVVKSITCKKITNYYKISSPLIAGNYRDGYTFPLFTYSQNGVVYVYDNRSGNDKFDTLFNINAHIGDKWKMPFVEKKCNDSLNFITVLNTGTKLLKGFSLKWWFVKMGPIQEGESRFYYKFDTITDRLGYRFDDLEYVGCSGGADETGHGKLRCYSDDAFGFYSTGISSSCDYVLDVPRYGSNQVEVTAYPNPADEKFNLHLNSKQAKIQTLKLDIHDLSGKLILSKDLDKNSDDAEISTVCFPKGMYMYHVLINGSPVKTGKLSIIR